MISKYFKIKMQEPDFESNLLKTLEQLQGKKVIVSGANDEFKLLNKKYHIAEKINIIAFTYGDIKKEGKFLNYKAIPPFDIRNLDYDAIFIVDDTPTKTIKFFSHDLLIENKEFVPLLEEEFKEEGENLNYLYKFKFDKTLPKLLKRVKNKKVVLYGAGAFLELIKKYFDISSMNVIAIADRRFDDHKEDETFLGYKAISPNEIISLNPDYVIVSTKMYIKIIEDLYYCTLKDTKIKIKPLLKKGFFELLKEV